MEPMAFEVREIDMDYEFDASRWFDFTRAESPAESQASEFWFRSAPSYAPSPFVRKLLLGEEVSDDKTEEEDVTVDAVGEKDRDNIYHHPSLNKTGNGIFSSQQGHNLKKVPNQPICKGPSNHKHTDNKPKFRSKPRSSTLMKPTASQLAKQNHSSKFHMQVDQIHDKTLCGTEVQAAKRQKLDGGLLRKVQVADTKPEMSFVHKIPKKDTTLDRNSQHSRTKITVPQEPDFATSQRAQRIRHKNDEKLEQESAAVYRFKARPFNRKLFDTPPSLPIRKKSTPKLPEFQEFHLKTSERAMQHSNITDALDGVNRESRRPSAMDITKHDVSEGRRVFKARPLNKKILSSRGDMGVSKRETTVPLEFSFHSEKRMQQDLLPTDLFSKLSIKSEIKKNNGSRTRFHQAKGFKENRVNSFQASGHSETNQRWTTPSRSLGIR